MNASHLDESKPPKGSSPSRESALRIQQLCQQFGHKRVLSDISFSVPTGSVFGLLGLNGAGKTTIIRHLLGLHRPLSGSVEVLDRNPITDRVDVMRNVGYLSEENTLPGWMKVEDLLRFGRNVYPEWDESYADELCQWFELAPGTRLRELSKGGRARAGLIAAIAHRPELLILDEPSSGLDPIARDDILEAIIRSVSVDGRTVLFSSHLLEEIARVCDHVAIIHDGRVALTMSMPELETSFIEWILTPTESEKRFLPSLPCPIPNALDWSGSEGEWSLIIPAMGNVTNPDPPQAISENSDWKILRSQPVSLDRLFRATVRPSEKRGSVQMTSASRTEEATR